MQTYCFHKYNQKEKNYFNPKKKRFGKLIELKEAGVLIP
jgi:hypothetical protein